MKNKILLAVAVLATTVTGAMAQSSVTAITDAASATFTTVAGICVTIGVFMIGYRLARKIR